MTMTEMAEVRPAYRLERGEYNHHAEIVQPGVPNDILPMDPALPPASAWPVVDRS